MATSINSSGVTFPDATTQTTAAAASIPSGSVVLFYQASAPTGWTQVTTLDDYALRITNSTGGGTGGTTAFSTVFSNQTPTITTSGLSAGATTISTAQMPSHTHAYYYYYPPCSGSSRIPAATSACGGSYGTQFSYTSGAQGGGGSHTHSISGSATSSAITLNVRYANIIICSKN